MTVRTPPRVQRATHPWIDRTQEEKWLAAHQHEYRGQWILLEGETLIAHGFDPRPLLKEAHSRGYLRPLAVYIPENDEFFWSGIV
ncbi:MAG TPA: DUF5678 domain-containing protein [Blastocatellia bacterium]|nr:DUF5678 domain-containing protein [Blastocatellia bacterium]